MRLGDCACKLLDDYVILSIPYKSKLYTSKLDLVDWQKFINQNVSLRQVGNYISMVTREKPDNATIIFARLLVGYIGLDIVDHINGDSLDHRKSNLRICSRAANCQNIIAPSRGISGKRGVTYYAYGNKWRAYANLRTGKKYLGYYDTVDEAAAVAEAYRQEHMEYYKEQ